MKKGFMVLVIGAALLLTSIAYAQNSDAILGKWWTQEKDSQVEVYPCDGKYCGKIMFLQDPIYPANDPKGMDGKPKVDRENPDLTKRDRPLLGLNMFWDFTYSGKNIWENGFIYDPRDGKTYKCKITMESPDHLKVRGYILITLIGKTNNFTRVK